MPEVSVLSLQFIVDFDGGACLTSRAIRVWLKAISVRTGIEARVVFVSRRFVVCLCVCVGLPFALRCVSEFRISVILLCVACFLVESGGRKAC